MNATTEHTAHTSNRTASNRGSTFPRASRQAPSVTTRRSLVRAAWRASRPDRHIGARCAGNHRGENRWRSHPARKKNINEYHSSMHYILYLRMCALPSVQDGLSRTLINYLQQTCVILSAMMPITMSSPTSPPASMTALARLPIAVPAATAPEGMQKQAITALALSSRAALCNRCLCDLYEYGISLMCSRSQC